MILILLLVFIQYVSTFNTNVNIPLNIFTIKSDDIKINNIFSFTDYDLEENKLELDKSMNIYSIFTNNYFDRCHEYNDDNCEYTFEEQENACKQIIELNKTYTMFYYGIYNSVYIPYVNYLISYNDIFPVQPIKYNINYHILGVYLLENKNDNSSNYKINVQPHEPDNFYKQMMLYLIPHDNKTISCPYWINREEED
jgi:hypothetical protein